MQNIILSSGSPSLWAWNILWNATFPIFLNAGIKFLVKWNRKHHGTFHSVFVCIIIPVLYRKLSPLVLWGLLIGYSIEPLCSLLLFSKISSLTSWWQCKVAPSCWKYHSSSSKFSSVCDMTDLRQVQINGTYNNSIKKNSSINSFDEKLYHIVIPGKLTRCPSVICGFSCPIMVVNWPSSF